jgi:hypothetical protein
LHVAAALVSLLQGRDLVYLTRTTLFAYSSHTGRIGRREGGQEADGGTEDKDSQPVEVRTKAAAATTTAAAVVVAREAGGSDIETPNASATIEHEADEMQCALEHRTGALRLGWDAILLLLPHQVVPG